MQGGREWGERETWAEVESVKGGCHRVLWKERRHRCGQSGRFYWEERLINDSVWVGKEAENRGLKEEKEIPRAVRGNQSVRGEIISPELWRTIRTTQVFLVNPSSNDIDRFQGEILPCQIVQGPRRHLFSPGLLFQQKVGLFTQRSTVHTSRDPMAPFTCVNAVSALNKIQLTPTVLSWAAETSQTVYMRCIQINPRMGQNWSTSGIIQQN